MAFEDDAKQVEGFALEPIGDGIQLRQRWNDRKGMVQRKTTKPKSPVIANGEKVDDGSKALVRPLAPWPVFPIEATRARALDATRKTLRADVRVIPLVVAIAKVVDAADIDQLFESELRFIAQGADDLDPAVWRQFHRRLAVRLHDGQGAIAKAGLQTIRKTQCRFGHGSARNGVGTANFLHQLQDAV